MMFFIHHETSSVLLSVSQQEAPIPFTVPPANLSRALQDASHLGHEKPITFPDFLTPGDQRRFPSFAGGACLGWGSLWPAVSRV